MFFPPCPNAALFPPPRLPALPAGTASSTLGDRGVLQPQGATAALAPGGGGRVRDCPVLGSQLSHSSSSAPHLPTGPQPVLSALHLCACSCRSVNGGHRRLQLALGQLPKPRTRWGKVPKNISTPPPSPFFLPLFTLFSLHSPACSLFLLQHPTQPHRSKPLFSSPHKN